MRRTGVAWLCVALAGCASHPRWRDPGPAEIAPPPVEHSLTMQRLLDQTATAAPLHPEPGDIWAGILPKGPAEALTPFTSGEGASHAGATARQPAVATVSVAHGAAAAAGIAPRARPAPGPAMVQLAAADTAQHAVLAWKKLQQRLPALVHGVAPQISSAEVNGQMVWRLRASGFATTTAAHAFCASVRAARSDCWVVAAVERR